jgi:hypothetical protein
MKTEMHCCKCCLYEDAVSIAEMNGKEGTDEQNELVALAVQLLTRRFRAALMPAPPAFDFQRDQSISGTCDT